MVAIREEMELDTRESATRGEVGDAAPADRGIPFPLEKETGRAVLGEEPVQGMGAEVFDQSPAQLAGDEVILEVDRPRLLPAAHPFLAGPGEEALVHLQ